MHISFIFQLIIFLMERMDLMMKMRFLIRLVIMDEQNLQVKMRLKISGTFFTILRTNVLYGIAQNSRPILYDGLLIH